MFMLDSRGTTLPKKKYAVCIGENYVRDTQVFTPKPEAFLSLSEEDIYLSSECQKDWKDWEKPLYLCQISASSENDLQEKLKYVAKKYDVPIDILESIPVDESCTYGESDLKEMVWGREDDATKLVEELGCAGYIQRFYEFLQGKFHPENILENDIPNLLPDQAWHVIYCMQEYFGIFSDRFERCEECGEIYDSYEEGCTVGEDTEPVEWTDLCGEKQIRKFEEEEYGNYCEGCRPD